MQSHFVLLLVCALYWPSHGFGADAIIIDADRVAVGNEDTAFQFRLNGTQSVEAISNDPLLTGNSAAVLPTQQAIRAFVEASHGPAVYLTRDDTEFWIGPGAEPVILFDAGAPQQSATDLFDPGTGVFTVPAMGDGLYRIRSKVIMKPLSVHSWFNIRIYRSSDNGQTWTELDSTAEHQVLGTPWETATGEATWALNAGDRIRSTISHSESVSRQLAGARLEIVRIGPK